MKKTLFALLILSLQISYAEITPDCKNQLDQVINHRKDIRTKTHDKKITPVLSKIFLNDTEDMAMAISMGCGSLSALSIQQKSLASDKTLKISTAIEDGNKGAEEAQKYFRQNKNK